MVLTKVSHKMQSEEKTSFTIKQTLEPEVFFAKGIMVKSCYMGSSGSLYYIRSGESLIFAVLEELPNHEITTQWT